MKPCRAAPMSPNRPMTWRYSCFVVSRPAMPRSQPSIIASERIQTREAPHAVASRPRQGSRPARPGPYATTAAATTTAAGVPGPVCGYQDASKGGQWANRVPWASWIARPIRTAAVTSRTPAAAAIRSPRRPVVRCCGGGGRWCVPRSSRRHAMQDGAAAGGATGPRHRTVRSGPEILARLAVAGSDVSVSSGVVRTRARQPGHSFGAWATHVTAEHPVSRSRRSRTGLGSGNGCLPRPGSGAARCAVSGSRRCSVSSSSSG